MIDNIDRDLSVPPKTVASLLAGIADTDSQTLVDNISLDSRRVSETALFCAVPGQTVDGRDFIEHVVNSGVAAVAYESWGNDISVEDLGVPAVAVADLRTHLGTIADRLYDSPSRRMQVIGVTGTNGKTTLVYFLAQAFEKLGRNCAQIGTLGIGKPDSLSDRALTTGDAIRLQKDFYRLLNQGIDTVCMEVSSHGLDQGRVNGVCFDVAVFTNLTQDHLDYHGSMERYGSAKARLFQTDELSLAVLNTDDEFSTRLRSEHRATDVLTFGENEADVHCSNLQSGIDGLRFQLHWQDDAIEITSPLLGDINLPNLLASAAVLLGTGHSLTDVAGVLPTLSAPPGRMEKFINAEGVSIIVDYSHTPDSLERALKSLRPLTRNKLYCVFGCGGDRDREKRPKMGAAAESLADIVIVTNDNPRYENPQSIVDHISAGMKNPPVVVLQREQAIARAFREASSGDVILVAGKGHEATQTIGDQKVELSDRQIAAALTGSELC
ncbi:MAG: UDP-N-acetylmuramoyl-L-alanyl-D-glutamate--2,6-diaminopimelate ligase [Pseudomonadota bacterium]